MITNRNDLGENAESVMWHSLPDCPIRNSSGGGGSGIVDLQIRRDSIASINQSAAGITKKIRIFKRGKFHQEEAAGAVVSGRTLQQWDRI